MNLKIRSHNTRADDDLREHAEKRLARLERYLPRVDDITIEVEYEETRSAAHRYAIQVTVHSAGTILRAEERASDQRTALDMAADVLSRQAQRHKRRLYGRHRTNEAKQIAAEPEPAGPITEPDGDEEYDEYLLGKIVRVKHFEAKPMSQEEALAQMDLLGHDFFLFLDAAANDYALLYKRRDGDYGLLTPRRG
ncbi:MAG: ribosome-associated translation inhibitor RaiA [Dehalococcoidia bacterium]